MQTRHVEQTSKFSYYSSKKIFHVVNMRNLTLILFLIMACLMIGLHAQRGQQHQTIEEISDIKDFKKLLRTKNNILVLFVSSLKSAASVFKIFKEAAVLIRGQGTTVLIECSRETKKMCKKLKVSPGPSVLRHYKDGEFHKDYDRQLTVQSLVSFMRDPTGDIPWDEDSTANDVLHVSDPENLARLIRRESKPLMVLFYAPWCGFCKQLKPHYADAASELKGFAVMAAVDVNRPENNMLRHQFNISGFPTMLFFQSGHMMFSYEGANKKEDLVAFMKNPNEKTTKKEEKPKEPAWSESPSDVVHLTTKSFDDFIKDEETVLVMFYAPWCGHCKKMKPQFEEAAAKMIDKKIPGRLAAVDATVETTLASRFKVSGYPTVKLFREGRFQFDVKVREVDPILELMNDPTKPPPTPPPVAPWSSETSDVVYLNEDTFKPTLKKKKHALVMFYAPWCKHCQNLKPEYERAASTLSALAQVILAAVDCTESSTLCKLFGVDGYPTLKYYNYYNKNQVDYQGGRKEQDIVNFMKQPPQADTPKDEL